MDRLEIAVRNNIVVSKTAFFGGEPCWEWSGSHTKEGYGIFKRAGLIIYAHRETCSVFLGKIPDGYHVDHLCRNRGCCNPAHLEAVTPRENNLRKPTSHLSHCSNGHEMTEENTVWQYRGVSGPNRNFKLQRRCRTCEITRRAERYRNWKTSSAS